MTPLKKALRRARRQKSLITTKQALADGLSADDIRGLVGAGHWVRVTDGLYRMAAVATSFVQDAMAAVLLSEPHAFAAGLTAAFLYGVFGIGKPATIEVAVRSGRSGRNAKGRVRRLDDLPKRDTARVQGVPALHPVRLIIELASVLGYEQLCDALDDLVIRKVVTLSRVERRMDELGMRRGAKNLRKAIASWGENETSDSVWNRRLARLLVSRGAPEPVLEYDVYTDDGVWLGRADMAWPDKRVLYEVQSAKHHAGPRKMAEDVARRRRFRAAGWTVEEATPAEIRTLDADLVVPGADPIAA